MLFKYTARNLDGEQTKGVLDAPDKHALSRILREKGFVLVSAKHNEDENAFSPIKNIIGSMFGVPLVEKMTFVRYLAVLISAGVDISRGLSILEEQVKNIGFKKIIRAIREEVMRGKTLNESFAQHPKAFSGLVVNMVAVGEESGRLVESLELVATQLEREHELVSKVRGALVYPAVVVSAMVIIGIVMFIYVVPTLKSVFGDLNASLPITTRIIFGLSDFLLNKWYLALAFIIIFIISMRFLFVLPVTKKAIDFGLMQAPMFGPLIRKIISARIARTLSSLIASGVPILRSIEITSSLITNIAFTSSLKDAMNRVQKGALLSASLGLYPKVYPTMLIQMIAVGEETGKLGDMLTRTALFYETEVDRSLKNLTTIIEPLLMLVIGGAVGVFAVSILGPMYTLIQNQI